MQEEGRPRHRQSIRELKRDDGYDGYDVTPGWTPTNGGCAVDTNDVDEDV